MSLGRFQGYLKNPFLGTHTPRLVKQTTASVDLFIRKGPAAALRKKKSIFDAAFGFHNLAVGKKFQELSWAARDKDPQNSQHFWLITRIAPTYKHPHRRHGKVWGQLVWDGKLWHDGEERPIHGAGVKKWRLVDPEVRDQEKIAFVRPRYTLSSLLEGTETKDAEELAQGEEQGEENE